MTIIHEDMDRVGGSAPRVEVQVDLVGAGGVPTHGFVTGTNRAVISPVRLRPGNGIDDTGFWQVDLDPSDLVIPPGTAYRVMRRAFDGGPAAVDFVLAPITGGPFAVSDPAVLVEAPAAVQTAALAAHASDELLHGGGLELGIVQRASGNFTIPTAVTASSRTGNVVTLTVAEHGFKVGQDVVVDVADATYDGTFEVTAFTATTIQYAQVAADDPDGGTGTVAPLAGQAVRVPGMAMPIVVPDRPYAVRVFGRVNTSLANAVLTASIIHLEPDLSVSPTWEGRSTQAGQGFALTNEMRVPVPGHEPEPGTVVTYQPILQTSVGGFTVESQTPFGVPRVFTIVAVTQ